MQNSFAMMNQRVRHLARLDVPDPNGGVARAADDDFVVVLQAKHGARVPGEDLENRQLRLITNEGHRKRQLLTLLHCSV